MRKTLRNLLALDMLYSFIIAALAVLVPIYLIDNGFDETDIGFIIAVFPLVFIICRLFFASIADQVGTTIIGILESIAGVVTIIVYFFSVSAQAFVLARLVEGVMDSSFWAIARTEVIDASGRKAAGTALSYFTALRLFSEGVGRIVIGFIIGILSFAFSFIFLFVLSAVALFLVFEINKSPFKKLFFDNKFYRRIFHKRPNSFWTKSVGLNSQMLVNEVLLIFLLPLYIYSELGLNYYETAALIGLFSIVISLTNLTALKLKLEKNSLLSFVALIPAALVLIPFLPGELPVLLIIIGIGAGCAVVLSEHAFSRRFAKIKNVSTEVGVTFVPYRIIQFLFIATGGLIIANFGYLPLFLWCGIISISYFIFMRSEIRGQKMTG